MGLLLTCISIILAFLSPAELLPSLAPYHLQFIVMAFAMAVSLVSAAGRRGSNLQSPQYRLLVCFWGAIAVSNVANLKLRWGMEGFLAFGALVVIYFLIALNTPSLGRIKIIAGVVIGCAVFIGLQAILAYHTGYLGSKLLLVPPDSPSAVLFGNRVRGYGFLEDPNDFAQFLLVSLCLLGLFWKRANILRNVLVLGPLAAVMLYAAYLTFSRGGLLGLGAIVLLATYRKGRRSLAFAAGGLVTIILYAFRFTGGREMNFENGRLMAWGAGISATFHHPLFGVGFRRFGDVNDLTAHNSFVLCLTELGFFGYFFWMALLLVTFMGIAAVIDSAAKTAEERDFLGVAYALRAALGGFLVTGWFLSRTYTETLYILLALSGSLIRLRGFAIPAGKFDLRRWVPATVVLEFVSIAIVYLAVKARLL